MFVYVNVFMFSWFSVIRDNVLLGRGKRIKDFKNVGIFFRQFYLKGENAGKELHLFIYMHDTYVEYVLTSSDDNPLIS